MSNEYANLMRQGIKLPDGAKAPGPSGRNQLAAFEPTQANRELVLTLSGNGIPEDIMAKLIGIAHQTLRKHFKQEIKDGRGMITARMSVALVREGLAGNVAAQRYWLGTHGGPEWRIPKESTLMPDVFDKEDQGETVHFFMPSNGRDEPEEEPGTTIEGTIEDTAA